MNLETFISCFFSSCFSIDARHSIQGGGGIIDVCHGGHTTRSCIPGEHGEPIHVKGWSFTLDGGETHHYWKQLENKQEMKASRFHEMEQLY
jgi:hypothetical protein